MDTNGKVTDTLPAGDKSGMLFFSIVMMFFSQLSN